MKQTVILCYELSDQEAHTLHQVKAHDVRAFAASKAFQSGVSLDQILSACHWKSHNTFTQFYLKDVAWADSEPSGTCSGCSQPLYIYIKKTSDVLHSGGLFYFLWE